MHSEPPPKDSANAKAVGVYLEDPRSLFLPWTLASIFSAADIVFLVTVLPSQRVPLRSSYQQSTFQTFFIVKNCAALFLRIFVIKPLCGAMGQRVRIGHYCHEGMPWLPRRRIATAVRLRVVIATQRIELGDFRFALDT
jgi:hypothetical protein